jgi:hypothetical protein
VHLALLVTRLVCCKLKPDDSFWHKVGDLTRVPGTDDIHRIRAQVKTENETCDLLLGALGQLSLNDEPFKTFA